MAAFDVVVRRLTSVENHPNADRLELAVVDGYRAVVAKGTFVPDELIAYIPEAAILPAALIEQLGLTGKLAGPEHNKVHAVRLRGALSQGIVLKAQPHWVEGQSVMEELGITKYVPEVPAELLGKVYPLEREEGLSFDVQDIKAWPNVFREGDDVVFTEKLHGVFMSISSHVGPVVGESHHYNGQAWVSSKGLLQQRMAFMCDVEHPNVYVRTALDLGLYQKAMALAYQTGEIVHILGELFGAGVQDLHYGTVAGRPQYRVFAIKVGDKYVSDAQLDVDLDFLELQRVPVLYRGPFTAEMLAHYTSGKETLSGKNTHLREGVVVTPTEESDDPMLGRVCLKSISEDYLLRKGGTEYT